eukprot:IDg9937t1
MATLRHGAPLELADYFDKQGKDRRFPRFLRLCDTVLSNSHSELGRVLGEGAFSKVRFGEDVGTSELFAVKEIDKHRSLATRDVALSEVDIMRRMSHPNIVNTYDIFVSLSHLYLVIEFMQGGELFDIIADQGHLSERNASQVIREIIVAVRYLHANGVVHCDIKPENILCKTQTWPLQVKLCDFGLASVVEMSDAPNASMTAMSGTPGYVAPEVIRRKQYGPPVDMWAVGVILYILLSGRMPFYGRSDVETLRRTALGQYSFPEREWRNISDDAKSLVRSLLQLNPEKRLTAEAALHHRWLLDSAALPTEPIQNDLSGLHSKIRKFRKAARAAILVERMKDLINNSPSARARAVGASAAAGSSPMNSPAPPRSELPKSGDAPATAAPEISADPLVIPPAVVDSVGTSASMESKPQKAYSAGSRWRLARPWFSLSLSEVTLFPHVPIAPTTPQVCEVLGARHSSDVYRVNAHIPLKRMKDKDDDWMRSLRSMLLQSHLTSQHAHCIPDQTE